jgi:hypothetical protein
MEGLIYTGQAFAIIAAGTVILAAAYVITWAVRTIRGTR